MSPTRVLSALRRGKWLVAALSALGLGAGVLATRIVPPEYRVVSTIWIETPSRGKPGTPIQGEELLESRAWVQLLRTYRVLDPVVRQRRLYLRTQGEHTPALFQAFELADRFLPGSYSYEIDASGRSQTLRHKNGLFSEKSAVGDSVGRSVGFRWQPRPPRALWGETVNFEVVSPREASQALSDKLESTLREDNFLHLQLSGTQAEATAATMNDLIRRFVDEAATQKREKLTLLSQVLDTQVTNQEQRLRGAEQSLESFRVGTVTQPREDAPVAAGLQLTQPTVYTAYFSLRQQLEDVRRDRRAIEEVLSKTRDGMLAVDAFSTIAAVRNAPDLMRVLQELSAAEAELRTLLARYTDDYKPVRDLRDRIATIRTTTIPTYAAALVTQLRASEADLSARIEAAGRELRQIPTRTQTEARLRREVQQAEALFSTLETSRQQAKLAEASAIPDVRILDSAVAPTRPASNSAPQLVLIGLLAGLGLGIGLAIMIDLIDRRFRYPEQVTAGLGLSILGAIPRISAVTGSRDSSEQMAEAIEAFRSVRLNLTHMFGPGQRIGFVVSSPGPGDGKSLISSNLAMSFADAGLKTVLVDGDIRRGVQHRTFAAERVPGLLDYLRGSTSVESVLRPTSHPMLTLVPSGSRRREGPELLGSGRLHDLLAWLGGRFDAVVFDAPPLGAGTDPFVLGTALGTLVLVLRAGETDRQLAEAKLQIIDRLPIRLAGAILNDVKVGQGHYRYYSYRAYGYAGENADGENALSLPGAG